jgi:preprotein translocase subunit SecY
MPYITASIVFQILTIAFPYFKELQKEGEYGRRKMAQWTRWAAIGLTLIQSSVRHALLCLRSDSLQTARSLDVSGLTAGRCSSFGSVSRSRKRVSVTDFVHIFAGIVNALPQQMYQTVLKRAVVSGSGAADRRLLRRVVFTIYVTQGERRHPG